MMLQSTYSDVPADIFINCSGLFYKNRNGLVFITKMGDREVYQNKKFVLSSIGNHVFIRTRERIEILDEHLSEICSYEFKYDTSRRLLDYFMGRALFREVSGDYTYLREYSESASPLDLNIAADNGFYVGLDKIVINNADELALYSKSSASLSYKINYADALLSTGGATSFQNVQCSDDCIFFFAHSHDWSKYSFYVIDIQSGKTVAKSNLLGPHFKYHNGVIYSVGRSTQKVKLMHLLDYSMETIDLSGELGEFEFETQCEPYFWKNKLYTALRKKGEDIYSYWGQINLETYKLEYLTEMLRDPEKKSTKGNKAFVSMIRANDEIVGVKVPGGILHIYNIGDHSA